jgi:hypothetical protein
MRKGNKVVVRAGAELWRDASSDDRSAWRAALDAEAAERRARGEEVWSVYNDCAGESRLAPCSIYRREVVGEWVVVKARCSAKRGWHKASGACLLRAPDGSEWYAFRKDVAVVGAGSGPAPKAPKALEGKDAEIAAWVEKVNAAFPLDFGEVRKVEVGRKYARVYRVNSRGAKGSVYCFVDRSNGDILKSASWKAPAKHARGNIYAADPLAGVGLYGAAYLA